MNLYLPSDNAEIKINAAYFDNSAEANKLQHNTKVGISEIQCAPKICEKSVIGIVKICCLI